MKKLLYSLALLGLISSVGVLKADACCGHDSCVEINPVQEDSNVNAESVEDAPAVEAAMVEGDSAVVA